MYYDDCGKTYNVNTIEFIYDCAYAPNVERIQFEYYSDCPTLGDDAWCAVGSCNAYAGFGEVGCYYEDCG